MKHTIYAIGISSMLLGSCLLGACGDDDLDFTQPSVGGVTLQSFGPCPLTRGGSMEVIGLHLEKVEKVLFPKGVERTADVKEYAEAKFTVTDGRKMTVTVPDEAIPGKLRLVVGQDTLTSKSSISFEEEVRIDAVETDGDELRAGDLITIRGEYVWNIVSATFADNVEVPAEAFVKNTRYEVQVAVPMAAVSGQVTVYDGNANEVQTVLMERLNLRQAVIERVSNEQPELGEEITLYGRDLDLIGCAHFPFVDSVQVMVNASGSELTCRVPATTVPGEVTLAQYSGKGVTVALSPLMIEVSDINPKEDLNAGDRVTISGTRLDKVRYILLPGDLALAADEYDGSATQISFTVPEGMGDGKVTLVQHENYRIETEKIAMHHEGAELPVWSGSFKISGWNGFTDLSWGGDGGVWETLKAGQTLSIYFKPNDDADYYQLRVAKGAGWSPLSGTDDVISLTADDTVVRINLTDAVINELVNEGGLVLTGHGVTITSITVSIPENIVWSGNWRCDAWQGNQELAWGGYDWSALQSGQKIVFTIDTADFVSSGWGCISPRMGQDWANLSVSQIDFVPSEAEQTVEFAPTDADIADLQNKGGLVITGQNYVLKKVSIK